MSSTLNYATLREVNLAEWLQSYISLPAFSYNIGAWKGASEIITQFNYSASKNFTIRRLPTPPENVNFCLVIRWRHNSTVYRYKLWQGVGEVLNEKLYNGEKIGSNFVLEVWSTNLYSTCSLTEAITFTTSIRSAPSTSYLSIDPYEEVAGVEVAAQSYDNSASSSPVAANLVAHWRGDTGVITTNPSSWTDIVSGRILASIDAADNEALAEFNNQLAFKIFTGVTPNVWSGAAFTVKHTYIVFSMRSWTLNDVIFKFTQNGQVCNVIQTPTANILKYSDPSTAATVIASGSARNLDQAYILEIRQNANTGTSYVNLYDLGSTVPLASGITNAGLFTPSTTNITIGDSDTNFAEILMYSAEQTDAQVLANLAYISNRYMAAIETFPTTQDSDIPGENN